MNTQKNSREQKKLRIRLLRICVSVSSGNRKDLKCVVRRLWSVVRGLWSVVRRSCQLIPVYVHYYVNTVQYYFTR
jgi:hypothetical protein